jgi:hypothetical protein
LELLPPGLTTVLETVLPPLIAAYGVFVAMVVVAWRRMADRRDGGTGAYPGSSRGSILGTTLGGYVSFLAIVLVFHVWLADEVDALSDAVWGGGFLAAVALGLAAASVAGARRSPRRR